jgi:hypothetical protein
LTPYAAHALANSGKPDRIIRLIGEKPKEEGQEASPLLG